MEYTEIIKDCTIDTFSHCVFPLYLTADSNDTTNGTKPSVYLYDDPVSGPQVYIGRQLEIIQYSTSSRLSNILIVINELFLHSFSITAS